MAKRDLFVSSGESGFTLGGVIDANGGFTKRQVHSGSPLQDGKDVGITMTVSRKGSYRPKGVQREEAIRLADDMRRLALESLGIDTNDEYPAGAVVRVQDDSNEVGEYFAYVVYHRGDVVRVRRLDYRGRAESVDLSPDKDDYSVIEETEHTGEKGVLYEYACTYGIPPCYRRWAERHMADQMFIHLLIMAWGKLESYVHDWLMALVTDQHVARLLICAKKANYDRAPLCGVIPDDVAYVLVSKGDAQPEVVAGLAGRFSSDQAKQLLTDGGYLDREFACAVPLLDRIDDLVWLLESLQALPSSGLWVYLNGRFPVHKRPDEKVLIDFIRRHGFAQDPAAYWAFERVLNSRQADLLTEITDADLFNAYAYLVDQKYDEVKAKIALQAHKVGGDPKYVDYARYICEVALREQTMAALGLMVTED